MTAREAELTAVLRGTYPAFVGVRLCRAPDGSEVAIVYNNPVRRCDRITGEAWYGDLKLSLRACEEYVPGQYPVFDIQPLPPITPKLNPRAWELINDDAFARHVFSTHSDLWAVMISFKLCQGIFDRTVPCLAFFVRNKGYVPIDEVPISSTRYEVPVDVHDTWVFQGVPSQESVEQRRWREPKCSSVVWQSDVVEGEEVWACSQRTGFTKGKMFGGPIIWRLPEQEWTRGHTVFCSQGDFTDLKHSGGLVWKQGAEGSISAVGRNVGLLISSAYRLNLVISMDSIMEAPAHGRCPGYAI